MQNKFGLKDFVLLVLIIIIGATLWLRMFQDDRKWDELKQSQAQIGEISTQLARVQRTLDAGIVAAPSGTAPAAHIGNPAAGALSVSKDPADYDWAREGAPVTWSGPLSFETDPYEQDGFHDGEVFTEIFGGQPPKITPFLYADVYGRRVVDSVAQTLGSYNHKTLKMQGSLAEAWQYDPNGMWLRVKIQDKARYSNGDPVLAEDARWTFHDLIMNPEIECERARSVMTGIKEVTVVGDPATSKVVEFAFTKPRFDNFSTAMGYEVLPKGVYSKWIESPALFNESTGLLIGSGPFKLERVDPEDQWTPPNKIKLVRNELYWGPRPPLAGLHFFTISDTVACLTAYTNGEGDMMRPASKQFDSKIKDESFLREHDARKWFNMRGGYSFIAWQCGKRNGEKLTPFHDKRVRLAMTHLIDRDKLRRDIGMNLSRPATGPFLSSTPQANPDIEPWPYDPDRARELLAEAGWADTDGDGILENDRGDEFEFEMSFPQGSEGTLRSIEYIKTECAKVGIRLKMNLFDWSVITPMLNNRNFDAITFAWSASSPESDPNQIWHSGSIENQGDNFIQWANADADRLIDEGHHTLDFDQRMKVWNQLHSVFHDEQPYTFMSELPWLRFTTKHMRNIQEYNSGIDYSEFWIAPESAMMPN